MKTPHHQRRGGVVEISRITTAQGTDRLLVEKREAAGLTQAQLAEKLGEYQTFVARLESGQRRVDVVEFLELAETLGFSAAEAVKWLQGTR